MASSDTDDAIIYSALLITLTPSYCSTHQRHATKLTNDSSARRQSEKLPKNREWFPSSNLVARLFKSWATRDVRQATLLSNKVARQSCSTLMRV